MIFERILPTKSKENRQRIIEEKERLYNEEFDPGSG